MTEVLFGGALGNHLVNGRSTLIRGFGKLSVSVEDATAGAQAAATLKALLSREGFEVGSALRDASGLRAELEAKLNADFAGRMTLQVTALTLTMAV